jgi:hypothetical protein
MRFFKDGKRINTAHEVLHWSTGNTKILETFGHLGCEGSHLKLVAESHW